MTSLAEQAPGEAHESSSFTRRDVLVLLLLAGLVALFFWRILTPNPADRAQFPSGDFTDQFYAFRLYEARALAGGRLPLWSENFNGGHPFLADVQSAIFYPIGLANTLLNVALYGPNFSLFALELEAILHFVLAGAFTYLFARRLIGGRAGAFAAALAFTFGGYLTSYPPLQLAILETATWLPLALYFVHNALDLKPSHLSPISPSGRGEVEIPEGAGSGEPQKQMEPVVGRRKGGARNFLYAGLVLGVAALAGHPQTFLFVLATCVAYTIFRLWTIRGITSQYRRLVLFSLVTLLIALGVAAAQWVPSFEYQQLSTRDALAFRQAGAGFPTLDILQFIFPGFTSAFASPLYIGILPLWLACLAMARRDRERVFWALVALAALILSFGFYVFGYALVYLLPGGSLFRQQERLAFIVSFALALLSGFGLNDILALAPGAIRWARRLFMFLPSGTALSFALLVTFFAAGAQAPSGRLAFLGDRAGQMLLVFALASAVVAVHLKGWVSARAFVSIALVLVWFDLFTIDEPANKAAAADPFPPNPLVNTVREDQGVFRVSDEGQLPGHFGIAYQLEGIEGISPLRLAHYSNLLALPRNELLPLLNVKYVFSADSAVPGAESVAGDGQTRLYRLAGSLPRAWLVGESETIPDDALALQRMAAPDFDASKKAILASPPPLELDPGVVSGSLTIEKREPERLTLAVNGRADGLLVLSENYYPGWVARVDGEQTEILRADISLRAIPVRAGAHRVELSFEPLSVKIGLAIAVFTLALSLIGFILL